MYKSIEAAVEDKATSRTTRIMNTAAEAALRAVRDSLDLQGVKAPKSQIVKATLQAAAAMVHADAGTNGYDSLRERCKDEIIAKIIKVGDGE